jgi:peptide subunit release factor 1 (eRF1)
MITRDQIRELARFQCDKKEECAVSFYFQPHTPQNKSHHEETVLVKELVRNALREVEKSGKNADLKSDLDRILELAGGLHGNQARAKAVFACRARLFWQEFDLPAQVAGTQLFVNRRFHLKPLAVLLGAHPRSWVALLDRQRARLFDLRLGELQEREGLFQPTTRHGRSDGYAGYDAGHAQRRVNDEALHHFKNIAEHLREAADKGMFDGLIVGCSDGNWPDFQAQLHPYVKQRFLGRFAGEVMTMSLDQVRESADQILQNSLNQRRHNLVREVMSQAKSNSRGVTGLRRVLRSVEMGEVQTLFIHENFSAQAVECPSCGHLDAHMLRTCPLCGLETRQLEDVCEAIIPAAIRKDLELFYVKDDPEFEQAGNIAALLRFRADQSKGEATLAS